MDITLSICVAIYNIKEEFLTECIESLIFDKSPDVEIILGDDRSEEYVEKICGKYVKKDSRVTYIRMEKNMGVSAVRNMMIKKASGKIITFVDGDDVVTKNYVKRIKEAANENFDIAMFGIKRFYSNAPDENGSGMKIVRLPDDAHKKFSVSCLTGESAQIENYGMKNCTPSSVCLAAYNREFLLKNNLQFRLGLKKSQDTVFNTSAYYFCGSLGYIPDILYLYRTNPASVCNRYSKEFDEMIFKTFECDLENLKNLYGNDENIRKNLYKYKLILIIIDNFRLNIFHKENPKKKRERKKDFLKFLEKEPYKTFFDTFDFSSYEWRERKLILKLARSRKFNLLDFMYSHPSSFKIYGWTANRISLLSKKEGNR